MINAVSHGILIPVQHQWTEEYQRERQHKEQAGSGRDSFKPTSLARRFMQSGLDASSSVTEVRKDELRFSLNYISGEQEKLSATGYYFRKDQSFEVNFSYRFQRAVISDGRQEIKSFELNFSLQAHQVEEQSLQPFKEKEDVIDFIRRLANEIMDASADEKKKLIGVILNRQDIGDIVSLEKGRIAKLLFMLISSVLMLEEMRHVTDMKGEAEQVILHPKRLENEGVRYEKKKDSQIYMSVSITELAAEIRKSERAEDELLSPAPPAGQEVETMTASGTVEFTA